MPGTEELSPTRTSPFAEGVRADGGHVPKASDAAHTAAPLTNEEKSGRPSLAASLTANIHIVGRRTRVASFLPGTSVGAIYDAHEQSNSAKGDATSRPAVHEGTGKLPPVGRRRATIPGTSAPAVSGVALLDDPYVILPMRRATLPTVAVSERSPSRKRANESYVDWYDRPDDRNDSSTHTPITGSLDRGKNSVASYYLFSQFGKDPSEFHAETSGHSTTPTARTLSLGTSYDNFIPAEEPSDSNKTVSRPAANVSKAPTGRKVEGTSRYEWNSFVRDPRTPAEDDDTISIGALMDAAAPPHTTPVSVSHRAVPPNQLMGHVAPGLASVPRTAHRAGETESVGDNHDETAPPLRRVPRLAPGKWSYVI